MKLTLFTILTIIPFSNALSAFSDNYPQRLLPKIATLWHSINSENINIQEQQQELVSIKDTKKATQT